MTDWREDNFLERLTPHLSGKHQALREPCPDAEDLCALAEGRVTGHERDAVAAHVNECKECSELYVRLLHFARPSVPVYPGEWERTEKRLGNWMEVFLRAQERRAPLPVAALAESPAVTRGWKWRPFSMLEWAAGITATIAVTAAAVTFLILGSPLKDAGPTAVHAPAAPDIESAQRLPEDHPAPANPSLPAETPDYPALPAPMPPLSTARSIPNADAAKVPPAAAAQPAAPVLPPAESATTPPTRPDAAAAPISGPNITAAVLSPEVKQSIAGVVQAELAAEMGAAANSQLAAVPGDNHVPAVLDPRYRVFIVSRIVSAQAADGQECSLTPGDVVTRMRDVADVNLSVQVLVTTSQSGDCGLGTKLAMSLQELQDMQDDFRERLDSGLQVLAQNHGKNGLPRGPAPGGRVNPDGVAAPDQHVQSELQDQLIEADNTEDEVARAAEDIAPSAFHPNRLAPGDSASLRLAAWDGNIWQQSNSRPQQAPPPRAPAQNRPAPSPPPRPANPQAAPPARPANPQPAPHPSAPARPAPATKSMSKNPAPGRPTAPNKSGATVRGAKPSPSNAPAGARPGAAKVERGPAPHRATGSSRFTPPRDAKAMPDGRGGVTYRSSKGEFHTAPNGKLSALKTPSGTEAKFNSRGTLASIHTAGGMTIHHAANGARRIETLHSDGTKVVSTGRNRGFVEHTFMHGGRPFVARTYLVNGHTDTRVYGRYFYQGEYFYHYVPPHFYAPAFYGWAYNPWAEPVAFDWDWGGAPWYGYYGYYFSPASYYPSAALWLTDFLLAANLEAAYDAQVSASNSFTPRDLSAANDFHADVLPFDFDELNNYRLIEQLVRVSNRAAPGVQLGSTAPGPIGTTVWNFRWLYVLAVEIA